jgi:cyanate permease
VQATGHEPQLLDPSQTRFYSLDQTSRSRLNTACVTSNFAGGAIGSALAFAVWNWGGWNAVMLAGAVLIVFALTVWLFTPKQSTRAHQCVIHPPTAQSHFQ